VPEMKPTRNGPHYPNLFGRIYLDAVEDVMGVHGMRAALRLGKLEHLIDHPPPNNLAKEFEFSDFAGLNQAIEEMYGPRGARGLSLRAGRATFAQGLKDVGPMVGIADRAFRLLPLGIKMKIGLRAMAQAFTLTSDQITRVHEEDERFVYTIERCPVCWERTADRPICYVALGLLQEGLRWGSGGRQFRIFENQCIAKGDPVCDFHIYKEPIA
jgi:predicted hydrocarbon binding protein